MKVLVATKKGQGIRRNDFCYVPEGEIVKFGLECDSETVDGHCGCRRSMVGVDCLKATTTFEVKETHASIDKLVQILQESNKKGGWVKDYNEYQWLIYAVDKARELVSIAEGYEVGTVLEKRGNKFMFRKV